MHYKLSSYKFIITILQFQAFRYKIGYFRKKFDQFKDQLNL